MNLNIVSKSVLHFFRRSSSIGSKATGYRSFTLFTKPYKLPHRLNPQTSYLLNISCNTSSSDLKSSGSNEPDTKLFDDEDFQNILKDFSNDFGLDSDSENLLNDIKKSLDEPDVDDNPATTTPSNDVQGALSQNFQEFADSDSVVIPSYEDLVSGAREDSEPFHIDLSHTPKLPSEAKRGITGVFDIAELVDVLRNEKLADIAVISIPKENHYADFLVLATANSPRHSAAVAEYVIKLYKMKKNKKDPFVIVEGEDASNWKALDMGNIILHIFLEETRSFYDIESLWLVDSEFDSGGTIKPDPVFDSLQEQMAFFDSLEVESSKGTQSQPIKETT